MPSLPSRPSPDNPLPMVIGNAAGFGAHDFCVPSHCLDEQEIAQNPDHQTLTPLLRFARGQRTLLARLPEPLDALGASTTGGVLGTGGPRGAIEAWWNDGHWPAPHRPSPQGGRWPNALDADTSTIVDGERSWLFDGQQLHPLDTTL
jgi:hypothetical protein